MVTGKLILEFIELLSVGLDNRLAVPLRLSSPALYRAHHSSYREELFSGTRSSHCN